MKKSYSFDARFDLGERVRFAKDIDGVVIGFYLTESHQYDRPCIRYEVRWLHNGESKTAYFTSSELESAVPA